MLTLDTEVYSNYFLLAFKCSDTGKVRYFEKYAGKDFDCRTVSGIMRSYPTLSFNGDGFDLPLIALALTGASTEALKRVADSIIVDRTPHWRILNDANVSIPDTWDHIDIMNVSPGTASLKIYGGRLHAPRLQDLPIQPDAEITPDQREAMRLYCVNDLDTTEALWLAQQKQIGLRKTMSNQYGMDLRSKSDAQIAETVITSELSQATGKTYRAPKLKPNHTFRYKNPGIVEFKTPQLNDVFASILAHRFELLSNGSVKMPDWLKQTRITVGGAEYQMGIGGLHSCEKRQCVVREDGHQLYEQDVASYYPNIIMQQNLAPETLGAAFLHVYKSLVDRRIKAKREGYKASSDTLKIVINGSFGKFGSKYSALYSPDLLIQTTITGQLCLLMLIERMVAIGVRVVSANTDGVVLSHPDSLNNEAEQVAWQWMLDTSYTLERNDYAQIASRDVNNYVAITPSGATKGKGIFAGDGLMKNPNQSIVPRAVSEYLVNGTELEDTINASRDIREFVTVRTVKGGAVWRGENIGKAIRFYMSLDVASDESIHYMTNSNQVPMSAGARPVMDLAETMPDDVDRSAYIVAAEKLLAGVGG